jgi:hypothetical protein
MTQIINTALQTVILPSSKPWQVWQGRKASLQKGSDANGRVAKNEIEVDFSRFTPDKYLFSWSTAVAGVEPEDDNHTIVTPHNKYINDNGNAWLNELILESYHSFILAENYLEHLQLPELSKGKILDAVAWVVEQQLNGYKEPVPTIFIDCLVATHRKKHPKLVSNIENRVIDCMSMGCDILFSQCSRCGKVFEEGQDDPCSHIRNQLGKIYYDSDGNKRKVAELCGVPGKKGSCVFKELSWVKRPAFIWAKLHGFIPTSNHSTGELLRAFVPRSRYKEAAREE